VSIKISNGVGKEKKALCKKVVKEGACVDCGLGFFMSCLIFFDSMLSGIVVA
jgi:hypothetical protein